MSPSSPAKKVLIFDWDDTICPSSFVDRWKVDSFGDLPLHYRDLFDEIGRCAERCLEAASRFGEVIIITNSDDGWVKFSAERFVPHLLPILPRYRVVSARTRYERFYPGQPLCWKAAAFAHEVNEIFAAGGGEGDGEGKGADGGGDADDDAASTGSDAMNTSCESMASTDESSSDESSDESDRQRPSQSSSSSSSPPSLSRPKSKGPSAANRKPKPAPSTAAAPKSKRRQREIISFGDSMEERTAVKIVSGQLASLPKSVMFVQAPTAVQLIGQLAMLEGHMRFVCTNDGSLDLEISPEQAQRSAEGHLHRSGKGALLSEDMPRGGGMTTTTPSRSSPSRARSRKARN